MRFIDLSLGALSLEPWPSLPLSLSLLHEDNEPPPNRACLSTVVLQVVPAPPPPDIPHPFFLPFDRSFPYHSASLGHSRVTLSAKICGEESRKEGGRENLDLGDNNNNSNNDNNKNNNNNYY